MDQVPHRGPDTPVASTIPDAPWFTEAQSSLRTFGKWFFLLLVCAYFGFCFGSHPSFLPLNLYTQGLALTPYQYRVLPMFVFRILIHIPLYVKIAGKVAPLHGDPYLVTMAGIAFASLLGAILATRATLRSLTGDPVYAFWASFLIAFMAQIGLASSWNNPFDTPYDVPAVMFFAISITLIVRGKWWAYYPVFVLAVLNRETACFITLFFAVWEWTRLELEDRNIRSRLSWVIPHVLFQGAVWVALKLLLAHQYTHNPTELDAVHGIFAIKIGYNLHELLKPQQWPLLLSVCGFSLPFLWIQRRWIGSLGLARACAVVLPLSLLGLLIVGVIVEIRIFADWIALVGLAIALILHNRFRPVPFRPTI